MDSNNNNIWRYIRTPNLTNAIVSRSNNNKVWNDNISDFIKNANEILEQKISERNQINKLPEKSNIIKYKLFSIFSDDLRIPIGSFKNIGALKQS
jgi:hypothetical protein